MPQEIFNKNELRIRRFNLKTVAYFHQATTQELYVVKVNDAVVKGEEIFAILSQEKKYFEAAP